MDASRGDLDRSAGTSPKSHALWLPQRKHVTDFKGPDGRWRKLVVEENGDAVIENVYFGDGQVSANVTPKTIEIKSRIF